MFSPTQHIPSPAPAPICFVYCDEKGKLKMHDDADAMLQLIKEPVGVVAVCGDARQGKSFLMNNLMNKLHGVSSGFQVGHTHQPCTKGLWLCPPIERTACDGTVYKFLLLDTEGLDAYDQAKAYSTKIFSLAILLSSTFVYNQVGRINEVSLDRLSLVTELTKHIRVRASGGQSTVSELGECSPFFVWLLRDFYLDLVDGTPRDYLERVLKPVEGMNGDLVDKNKICESIRALFPNRECLSLVRPLIDEKELQRLDQIPLESLRPDFIEGLEKLTNLVLEKTRPKQLRETVMTGPFLVKITKSFLNAINDGAVPTIISTWESAQEAECRRAYTSAKKVYKSAFDLSTPPEEAALQKANEEAVRKSKAVFKDTAVGDGPIRQKYEKKLENYLKKTFEGYKRAAFAKASLQCSNAVQNMEKELRAACHAPDAKIDGVFEVLDNLVSRYEASCHGSDKWQKLAQFYRQSLQGLLVDFIKKQLDQMGLLKKKLEDAEAKLKKFEAANPSAQCFERERPEKVQERCKTSGREAKRATKLADEARTEAPQRETNESQQIESLERHIEYLERQKIDLAQEVNCQMYAEKAAGLKVALLEDSLKKFTKYQRLDDVQVITGLLKAEREAREEANRYAEIKCLQLKFTQERIDFFQERLTQLRGASHGKRSSLKRKPLNTDEGVGKGNKKRREH